MTTSKDNDTKPIFEIVPGKCIGPFALGMSRKEIAQVSALTGIATDVGAPRGGMSVDFDQNDRAVRIEAPAEFAAARLSLAGEELRSVFNDNVRRLLSKLTSLPDRWTEPVDAGIAIFHWEMSDQEVFSFMVFLSGHRDRA